MLRSLLRYKNYSGDKEIKRAVEYLSEEERRLIKITPSENGAYWDAGVSLTANGVNLAEGDKTDVGVEIDE
jgi:hypothetical protein